MTIMPSVIVTISEILGETNIFSRLHLYSIVPGNIVENCLSRGVISHIAFVSGRVNTVVTIIITILRIEYLKREGSIRRGLEGGH